MIGAALALAVLAGPFVAVAPWLRDSSVAGAGPSLNTLTSSAQQSGFSQSLNFNPWQDTVPNWLVGIAAPVSVVVSIAAVIMIYQTLREARLTTRAAIMTSEHARRQLEAAQRAYDFERSEAERQFDAFLFVGKSNYELVEGPPPDPTQLVWKVTIEIKNGGSWPAFVTRRGHNTYLFKNEQYQGGGGGWPIEEMGTEELRPGESLTFSFGGGPVPDTSDQVQHIEIRLKYRTVDGRERHRVFWLTPTIPTGNGSGRLVREEQETPRLVADMPSAMSSQMWIDHPRNPTLAEMEEIRKYYAKFK